MKSSLPSSGARPTLSVCLASYNGAAYLREQIDSILSQLDPGDELVVSDDGSTDGTPAILASYGTKIRLVGTMRAGGVVKNFERALEHSRGELIALCDQDDVWLDGRVVLIRDALARATLLMMNGTVVDERLKPTGQDIFQLVGFHSGFFRTLLATRYVGCCMAFRRELLAAALPFPRHIRWHDWYLAALGELLFTTEVSTRKTILFRRHSNNASPTGKRSKSSLRFKVTSRLWMTAAVAGAAFRKLTRSSARA